MFLLYGIYSKAAVIYFDYVALLLLAPPQALPHAGARLDLAWICLLIHPCYGIRDVHN